MTGNAISELAYCVLTEVKVAIISLTDLYRLGGAGICKQQH